MGYTSEELVELRNAIEKKHGVLLGWHSNADEWPGEIGGALSRILAEDSLEGFEKQEWEVDECKSEEDKDPSCGDYIIKRISRVSIVTRFDGHVVHTVGGLCGWAVLSDSQVAKARENFARLQELMEVAYPDLSVADFYELLDLQRFGTSDLTVVDEPAVLESLPADDFDLGFDSDTAHDALMDAGGFCAYDDGGYLFDGLDSLQKALDEAGIAWEMSKGARG